MFSNFKNKQADEDAAAQSAASWTPGTMAEGFLLALFIVVTADAGAAAASASSVAAAVLSNVDAAFAGTVDYYDNKSIVLADNPTDLDKLEHRQLLRKRMRERDVKLEKATNGAASGVVATLSHPVVLLLALSVCAVIQPTDGGPGWLVLAEEGVDFANTIAADNIGAISSVQAVLAQVTPDVANHVFGLFHQHYETCNIGDESFKEQLGQASGGGAAAAHGTRFAWRAAGNRNTRGRTVTVHTRNVGFCDTFLLLDGFTNLRRIVSGTIVAQSTMSLILRGGVTIFNNLGTDHLAKVCAQLHQLLSRNPYPNTDHPGPCTVWC
jgi:hypothetical protein